MESGSPQDRRANKRINFIKEVEVVGSGILRCSDLSIGGLYIETVATYPLGSFVDLKFKLRDSDEKPIKVKARILYQHAGVGAGLGFVDLSPEDHKALTQFIDEFG